MLPPSPIFAQRHTSLTYSTAKHAQPTANVHLSMPAIHVSMGTPCMEAPVFNAPRQVASTEPALHAAAKQQAHSSAAQIAQ